MQILAVIIIIYLLLFLQSKLFKKFALKNVEYECSFSIREATEGDHLFLIETIYNGKLLPIPWVKASLQSSRWLEFAGSKSTVVQESRYVDSSFLLKSYQKTTRRWKVKCLKRGIYSCKGTMLLSSDLLGMEKFNRLLSANALITVYPATVDLDGLFVPASYLQGETIVRRWIIDDPFIVSGTKEYSSSDPMNRIHWMASARHGKLMVRKNDFTALTSIAVILNIQSLHIERNDVVYKEFAELGIRVSATLFDIAMHDGYKVRFCSNACAREMKAETAFSESASGREHISQLMRVLAGIELRQDKSVEPYLESIKGKITNSDIYFITTYFNEQLAASIMDFKKDSNNIIIMVLKTIDEDARDMIEGEPGIYLYRGMDVFNDISYGLKPVNIDEG